MNNELHLPQTPDTGSAIKHKTRREGKSDKADRVPADNMSRIMDCVVRTWGVKPAKL